MDGRFDGVVLWPMPRQRPAHELRRQAVFKGIFLALAATLLFQRLRLLAASGGTGNEEIETNSSLLLRPGDEGERAPQRMDKLDKAERPLEVSSEPFHTVELQEENRPWQVLRLLVPLSPEVAAWWNNTEDFVIRATPCESMNRGGLNDSRVECLHLEVKNEKAFSYHGRNVQAIETELVLPKSTIVKDCRFTWVRIIRTDLPELDGRLLRALHLSCPVSPSSLEGGIPNTNSAPLRGGLPGMVALFFFGWLLLPQST
ncbi:unnamed protein product [Symbiodinium natans]|uniref:Uncharacterized protein n=1 Tax=Symbiodinium natans TaxID=878477 RepID=A0A812PI50_9DINO|nr:unnamed protein product [Symbiodinium natans]